MKIQFPSREFDEAVAAICHGTSTDEQMQAVNDLLRGDARARDEYILRAELHSRLASQLDLFPADALAPESVVGTAPRATSERRAGQLLAFPKKRIAQVAGLAAGLMLVAAAAWQLGRETPAPRNEIAAANSPKSDWQSSAANLPGQEYPRINSERRAQFRIKAPDAKNVSINIGMPHAITRSEDGIWTITTAPLGIGFHFYRVNIDGRSVADSATRIFRGGGGDWYSSAIEVPTGEDFHEQKNVAHGELREHRYFSQTTGSWRRAFVYTPPGYERDPAVRYPALYLLHGRGEDETCWPTQGRAAQIMDNLIAEGKATPMILVMDSGVAQRPGEPEAGFRGAEESQAYPTLEEVFMRDLLPAIDQSYRTIADRDHRAVAGLSLGGAQALEIGLRNFDQFAYLGSFSGVMGAPGRVLDPRTAHRGTMAQADQFNRDARLLFLSVGAEEPDWVLSGAEQFHQALRAAGIEHHYYLSSDTAHEWHTWRRSLREFASLLFKK